MLDILLSFFVENKRMASEIPTRMLNHLDNEVSDFKLIKFGALVIGGLLTRSRTPFKNIVTFCIIFKFEK
jgi:hypothetical protein